MAPCIALSSLIASYLTLSIIPNCIFYSGIDESPSKNQNHMMQPTSSDNEDNNNYDKKNVSW